MKLLALASAVVTLASPILAQTLCTTNYMQSPLYKDCKEAYAKLPKPLPSNRPVPCILIYAPRWTLAEYGSCKIEGYSSGGGAACLDRASVIAAAGKILGSCGLEDRVEGGAAIKTEAGFEGVQLLVSDKGLPGLGKRAEAFKA